MVIEVNDKIILGTVQLGIPYGINNSTGKPSEKEAFDILNFAFEKNIRALDSADAYGEALNIIGYYQTSSGRNFNIINKFKLDEVPLKQKLSACLTLLKVPSLYCYMYHQFSDYQSGLMKKELLNFKQSGFIKRIGVSLYGTDQLKEVIRDEEIDLIQLPVNILDLSQEKINLLLEAKSRGKEIHARSVFLQGLLLKDPDSLTGNLKAMKPYLKILEKQSLDYGLTIKEASFNYIIHQDFVDKVVLGIEKVDQLRENLNLIDLSFPKKEFDQIQMADEDQYLLNPVNWKV